MAELRPPIVETPRLRLVVLLPRELDALAQGDTAKASQLAGVSFPEGWPDDAEARAGLPWHLKHLRTDSGHREWRVRVMVEKSSDAVVGATSFKGPPDRRGEVEIGWGVNEECRRRGFALEGVTGAMEWAILQPRVRIISATIPEENVASEALASKLGMVRTDDTRRGLPLWVRSSVA